jgi:hypothetical protein
MRLEIEGGLNTYAFMGEHPLRFVDPTVLLTLPNNPRLAAIIQPLNARFALFKSCHDLRIGENCFRRTELSL